MKALAVENLGVIYIFYFISSKKDTRRLFKKAHFHVRGLLEGGVY